MFLCRELGDMQPFQEVWHLLKGTQESLSLEENSLRSLNVFPIWRVKEDQGGIRSVLLMLCPCPICAQIHVPFLYLPDTQGGPLQIQLQLLALCLLGSAGRDRREGGLRGPVWVSTLS